MVRHAVRPVHDRAFTLRPEDIMKIVIRAISNLMLSALMMATLLWGGCVSCPQFFMFPTAQKDCCKAGHCERSKSHSSTPGKECNRMAFVGHGFVEVHAELPTVIIPASDLVRPAVVFSPAVVMPELVEHSPPELQILNSFFLI
jgi:hypothetical protein